MAEAAAPLAQGEAGARLLAVRGVRKLALHLGEVHLGWGTWAGATAKARRRAAHGVGVSGREASRAHGTGRRAPARGQKSGEGLGRDAWVPRRAGGARGRP